MLRYLVIALGITLTSSATADEEQRGPDPLFASTDVFDVTITAPFYEIMKERSLTDDEQGTLSYTADDGSVIEFQVGIRARGKSRRNPETCEFSPLRLNFRKSAVKDTLFHKQDKLKLVTHCENKSGLYEQALLREYLAYQILNVLHDASYRARLIRVTYVDTNTRRRDISSFGILIEHKDRLGKRIGQKPVDSGSTSVSRLHRDHLAMTSLFQYLIGNTDFSPVAAPAGDNCCHNYALFGKGEELYYSIPYDFDMSGIVDAKYATPNPRFRLRSVKQRLYRGRCSNNDLLPQTINLYNEKRDAINEAVRAVPEMMKRYQDRAIDYIDEFYDVINDDDDLQKRIVEKCI